MVCVLTLTSVARAAQIPVTTDPPGARVWLSLEHHPAVTSAGVGPLSVEVPEGKRLRVIARAPGYYPACAWLDGSSKAVSLSLTPFPADLNDLVTIGQRPGLPGPWIGPYGHPDQARRVVAGATPEEQWDEFTWSPDGRWVAWHRAALITTEAGFHEYVMRLILLDPRTLERHELGRRQVGVGDYHFDNVWTADGEYLLISRPGDRGLPYERLFVYEPATGTERLLLADPEASCYFPAPLGDGRVAYMRVPRASADEGEIWVCDWDGGDRHRLGLGDPLVPPAATLDGAVLWTGLRGLQVWTGGEAEVLLPPRVPIWAQPTLSPDGEQVYLCDSYAGDPWGDERPSADYYTHRDPVAYTWSRAAGLRPLPPILREAEWLPDGATFYTREGKSLLRLDAQGRTVGTSPRLSPHLPGVIAPLPWSALSP